jgi:hypothetical protein
MLSTGILELNESWTEHYRRVYKHREIEIQNEYLINNQINTADLMLSQSGEFELHWFYLSHRGNLYDDEIHSL